MNFKLFLLKTEDTRKHLGLSYFLKDNLLLVGHIKLLHKK